MVVILIGSCFALIAFFMMKRSNRNRRSNHREKYKEMQDELRATLKRKGEESIEG